VDDLFAVVADLDDDELGLQAALLVFLRQADKEFERVWFGLVVHCMGSRGIKSEDEQIQDDYFGFTIDDLISHTKDYYVNMQ
jgi:aminopeptidase-like protein